MHNEQQGLDTAHLHKNVARLPWLGIVLRDAQGADARAVVGSAQPAGYSTFSFGEPACDCLIS